MSNTSKGDRDILLSERGKRHGSPLATTVFVGLRFLDGFVLQRALLLLNPVGMLCSRFGIAPPIAPPAGTSLLPIATIVQTGLTPYQNIIWSMSLASAVKHIYWILFTSKEPLTLQNALLVCFFNAFANGANTLLFSIAGSNPTWHPYLVPLGFTMVMTGLLVEAVSEAQRRAFKDKPENEGKPYSSGLFAYARSINYFGYSIWRTGFALAGGGVAFAAVTALFWARAISQSMVPVLDDYCSKRYGAQWAALKQKVPWKVVPGIY